MNLKKIFISKSRLRLFWRIVVFFGALLLLISPLFLIHSSLLQFLGACIVLVLLLYFNSRIIDKIPFIEYGLILTKYTVIYFLAGIIIASISVIIMLFFGAYIGALKFNTVATTLKVHSVMSFAFKMILVAFIEEAVFRGYLYTNIQNSLQSLFNHPYWSMALALFFSSILFSLAHFNTNHFSTITFIGLLINGIVWCVPFILTKNLGLSIGMHASWNFVQHLLGFTMSGNEPVYSIYNINNIGPKIITGGPYGPEAGLLGLLGYLLMLHLSIMFVFFLKKILNQSK